MIEGVEQQVEVKHTEIHSVHRDDIGSRMGMWLFLFTELILFGGMFFLYSVYRFMHQEEFHIAAKELNTLIGTLNTAILLTSSLTMALSITAIQKNNKKLSLFFQGITLILAFGFLVNKFLNGLQSFIMGHIPVRKICYQEVLEKYYFLVFTM